MNQLRYLYNEQDLHQIDRYYYKIQQALDYQSDSLRKIIDQKDVGYQIKTRLINGICKSLEGVIITQNSLNLIQRQQMKTLYFLNIGIDFALVVTNDYFTFLVQNYQDQRIDIVTPLRDDILNYPIPKDESLLNVLYEIYPQFFELREQILLEMANYDNLTYSQKVQKICQVKQLLFDQEQFIKIKQHLFKKYCDYYEKQYQGLIENILKKIYKLRINYCQSQQQIRDVEKYRFHSYSQISENIDFERMERIQQLESYKKKQFKQIKSIEELQKYGYVTYQDNIQMIIINERKYVRLYVFNYLSIYQEVDKFIEEIYRKYQDRRVEYIRIHPAFLKPSRIELIYQILDFVSERQEIFSNQRQNGKFIYEVFTKNHMKILEQYMDTIYSNNVKMLNEVTDFVAKNFQPIIGLNEQIKIIYSQEFVQAIDKKLSQLKIIRQDFDITEIKLVDFDQSKLSNYNIIINEQSELHSIIIVFSSQIGSYYNKVSIGKKLDIELINLRQCHIEFKAISAKVAIFYLKKILSLSNCELVKGFLQRKPNTIHQILKYIEDELDNKVQDSYQQQNSSQSIFNIRNMIHYY